MSSQEDFKVNESMFSIFQLEIQMHTDILRNNIFELTNDPINETALDICIRASTAIKGAVKLVKIQLALRLSIAIEDFLIYTQNKHTCISQDKAESLLNSVDFLSRLSQLDIEQHETPENSLITERNELISTIESYLTEDNESHQKIKPKTNPDMDISLPQNIDPILFDLYKIELQDNALSMSKSLLLIEQDPENSDQLEQLMRSSHSIRGSSGLLKLDPVAKLSQAMEDYFVGAQSSIFIINNDHIKLLLKCVDILNIISKLPAKEHLEWIKVNIKKISACIEELINIDKSSKPTSSNDSANETSDTYQNLSFSAPDIIDPTMLDLFTTELGNNIDIITNSLLELENDQTNEQHLEQLMRASHSIKGAARLLGIDSVVKLAHIMEDCFVSAQNKNIVITDSHTDVFLDCVDILKEISALSADGHKEWLVGNTQKIIQLLNKLDAINNNKNIPTTTVDAPDSKTSPKSTQTPRKSIKAETSSSDDSVVRVSSKRINRLMSLAGELSVSSNWVKNHTGSMLGLKKKHNELIDTIDRLRVILEQRQISELEKELLNTIQNKASNFREKLTNNIIDLDDFDRRSSLLSERLNHQIISSRMRPFKDSTQGYQRMVRDISRSLNKKIKLEIIGEETNVDRDILEKIEAPVNHMIRNAIDHGIEMPDERTRLNKPATGTIQLKAAHNAGRLSITVSDDGRGVDIEKIREKVLDKNLVNKKMADNLSKSELLDFLFLPAFSTRENVTEISGRGVGLDVVHSSLQQMRGKLHSQTELGEGMSIHMELPLTLSVIRSLLVSINNELYAFPLAAIHNLITIKQTDISTIDDKQYISIDDNHIGLIHTAQILGLPSSINDAKTISVIIIGDWNSLYGLVVDEIIGERGLAIRPLDSRLGKIKDINSTALTDNGEPVLIFDVDDLIQSIEDIISGKNIKKIGHDTNISSTKSTKRILVVDDSLTVREVEKKLLESNGYYVDIAIDGVDAWNTVRSGDYDLVVTDVDMPRMNGIELVSLIKNDGALRNIPVMMVSYKDRQEDRQKGLDAGADYYLTKGSFHDETLVEAVRDLIGDPL